MIKNKHGDIPVMILVVGVFAICGLAILSFIGSNKLSTKDSLGIGLIEEINSDVEKYYFYLNVGDSEEVAATKINAFVEDNILIIKRDRGLISVEYLVP